MKRHETHVPGTGFFGKAVATATLLGCTIIPQTLRAAPQQNVATAGIYLSILSPTTDISDASKQLEISAFYQASPTTGGVTTLELYVDGQQEAVKNLDSPEMKGVVSFVLAPGTLSPGEHHFVITVSASDAEVASVKTALTISEPIDPNAVTSTNDSGTSVDGSAPAVAITAPLSNSTVVGTIDIKVDAHDNSGKPPYVSLFIDHNFKTLRNFPPFDFAWDTTRVQNGYHTIEVWGYNDDQAVGHALPMTVYVNNPGGRTTVRHDLLDTVPTRLLIKAADIASKPMLVHHTARPATPRLLAQSSSAVTTNAVRLAAAQKENSSVSAQTMLMAPFLKPDFVTPLSVQKRAQVRTMPVLATGKVASDLDGAQLAGASMDAGSVTNAAQLSAPTTFSIALPSRPEAKQTPMQIASAKTTTEATTVRALPGLANDDAINSNVTIERSSAEIGVEETEDAALEAPSVQVVPYAVSSPVRSIPPGSVKETAPVQRMKKIVSHAVLADTTIDTNRVMIGATRMASSMVDSATLFTPVSSLQTPTVSMNHVSPAAIAFHRVEAMPQTLGSSNTGFPVHRLLRGQGAFQVVLNNHIVLLSQPLQDHKSFLFAPFRQIFESEGGVMAWNATAHSVHALNGSRDIELTIGSKSATVNQQIVIMNASPYLTYGHTMVPLAFVPVALDATVSYDPASGHIVINSKE
jgi:hypothetical protein